MIQTLKYWLLRGFIFFAPLSLMACTTAQSLPKEVLVPLPVPCEVEQVEKTELPTASADADIFELAQVAAARVKLLLAENTRLRAANTNPCPATLEPAK
jgi:hypothetical protein